MRLTDRTGKLIEPGSRVRWYGTEPVSTVKRVDSTGGIFLTLSREGYGDAAEQATVTEARCLGLEVVDDD